MTDPITRLETGEAKFFHGGPRGLREILPPSETGVASCANYGAEGICKRDRVYITTDLSAAIMFASINPFGAPAVYEVEPVGLEPDPDCTVPGLSYQARRATVLRRIFVPGKLFKKAYAVLLRSVEG